MSEQHIPHIQLVGNPEENFYSLGRRDKIGHTELFDQISKLCARSHYMAKILKMVTTWSGQYSKRGSIDLHREILAYADGLEKPVEDVYFMLLLPEIVASFNKWLPNLLGIIPGCSSLFVKDQNNGGVTHGRILDYAIAGPFEQYERCISYQFKNRLQSFSYSTVGMPFPGFTSMNEKGLSLALHYKHGEYFDISGDSIFSIMYQLTSYCTNIHEVKKYLKSHPSISNWGIYVSDHNGEVASFDIRGNEVYQEKFDLDDHKYLYFNNRPIISDSTDHNLQPYGNLDQCIMRKRHLKEKMKKFNYHSKDLSLETLKALTEIQPKRSKKATDWSLPTITPSSVQAVVFNNKSFKSLCINGLSPKFFNGNYIELSNLFTNTKQKIHQKKSKLDPVYAKGQQSLAMAQSNMDNGNVEKAYHNLQMAIEYFNGYPEECIATFFFLVWQYIHEESEKDLGYIYQEFVQLENLLPEYLNDHLVLFIMRLNRILDHSDDLELRNKIKNKNLLSMHDKEIKMKGIALKFLRRFTIPRIEILDIIYIYA